MKLVIDISEEDYKSACKREFSMDGSMMIYNAIREGTEYKERPRGEWVESKERKGHFYCSECIQQDAAGKWRELFDYKYNFCPNCGATMRKEGEKE